jgi:LytS/YehU family sensor histidine kinase
LEENDKSHAYLTRFAKLVRMLLDNADQPFISLKKEVEFLELYLSLENLRVPDLNYSIEMETDIFAEQVIIPNMILQPYIENAIWHGLSHKTEERRLQVKIFRKADGIAFHILDNGVGRRRAEELKSQYRQQHNSKGMELLSKRFKLLAKEYGTDIQTSIVDLIEGNHPLGTLVEIIVPQLSSEPLNQISHVANYHS